MREPKAYPGTPNYDHYTERERAGQSHPRGENLHARLSLDLGALLVGYRLCTVAERWGSCFDVAMIDFWSFGVYRSSSIGTVGAAAAAACCGRGRSHQAKSLGSRALQSST